MNLLSILWFIVATSAKNRVRAQVKRLKQPRYLVATIVGLAYFWSVFLRRLAWNSTFGGLPEPLRAIIPFGVGVLGVLLVLPPWLFARDRTALTFTEAEIQLLFPAPVSRASLILYKVARSLLLIFVSAGIATLIFGARISGHGVFFLVGFWLALSMLTVHEMVASFAREALILRGVRGVAALIVGLGAVVAGFVALAWTSFQSMPALPVQNPELEPIGAWVQALELTPFGRALTPFIAPAQAALASAPLAFGRAAAISTGVLFALTLILLRTDVSFEEASVVAAERRAKAAESRRGRRARSPQSPKKSLRLPATGRPEWAIAWKGRVAARRLFGPQLYGLLLPIFMMAAVLGFALRGESTVGWNGAVAIGLLAAAGLLVVLGPNALRADLRMDMPQIDILRTLPLSGAQVMAGQILGPLTVLVPIQWACLGVALVVSVPMELAAISLPLRVSIALSAALLAPPLTLMGLMVQNAAVLLFPGWVATRVERARGFEVMGQRLLTFAGSLVVWMVGLLPAALLGGIVLLVVALTVGRPAAFLAAPIAASIAAVVLAAEAFFAVQWMGRMFERHDLTLETPA